MDVPSGVSAGPSVDSAGSDDAGEGIGLSVVITWSALVVYMDPFAWICTLSCACSSWSTRKRSVPRRGHHSAGHS